MEREAKSKKWEKDAWMKLVSFKRDYTELLVPSPS